MDLGAGSEWTSRRAVPLAGVSSEWTPAPGPIGPRRPNAPGGGEPGLSKSLELTDRPVSCPIGGCFDARMRAPRRRLLALLAVAASLAAVLPIVGLAAPNDPVLPDLVADPPQRQQIANYTYPDGTQALLLRFDGYVHNIGPGPFEIRATDRVGSEYTNVRQYISTVGGGTVAWQPPPGPPVVKYETADGHNHWHLQQIARYSLWNSAKTAEVAPGMKAGFCLIDSERTGAGPASAVYLLGDFCGKNLPTKASVTMGVSAGWRDIYNRELSFQWVDISDVRPGNYWVAAEIDTNNVIKEADETNNSRAFAAAQSVVPGHVAAAVNAGTLPAGAASAVNLASTTFGAPGARRFRIESLPGHGTLSSGATTLAVGSVVTGPGITYTPASGYSGPDTFDFSAFDSTSAFPRTPPSAAVSLTVGAQAAPQVAVSGAPETLDIGGSAQLTATVVNAAPGVTWSVNGVAGGNTTVGTVSTSGLYRAPAALPDPTTVTIRAASTAAPTAFGEAAIRITDPGNPTPAPQPPTNLIANPSFETTTANWISYQAGITRTQLSDAPNGVWAAKITRTTGTSFTIDDSPETVASASTVTPYSARAFVKAASTSSVGKTVRLYLREATPGASGRYIRTVSGPPVALTNGFQDLTSSITVQADGNEVDMYVAQDSATTGDAFYIDQVSLAAASSPTPGNTPPTASFTASTTTPAIGQTVTFTDTSTDPGGSIALREWDLDGNGSFETTGLNPSRSYATAGDVTVSLRVTDNGGAPATTTKVIAVQAAPPANTPPAASFTASTTTPAIGQSVTFTDTSTDADGTISTREWDLDGNGSFEATGASVSKSYASAGNVTVSLRVTDDDAAPSTTTKVIAVQSAPPANTPPVASFTATPTNPAVNQSVSFVDTSNDSDGTIAGREWDLDGNGSFETTGASVARSYTAPGDVIVSLRVTDNGGAPATTTRVIAVQAAPPAGQNLVVNPSFEVSTANWFNYQSTSARTPLAGAPDGAYVATVTRTTGTSFTIDDNPRTLTSGVTTGPYLAQAYVRASATSSVGKPIKLFLRETNATGGTIRTVSGPSLTLTSTFQPITASITLGAAGRGIDMFIAQDSAVAGNAFQVDKVSLVPPS